MSANRASPEHDQIYMLLPWYVNGTLDSHERASVVAHVEHCSDCRQEVEFLTQMQQLSPQSDQIAQLPQAGLAATLRRIEGVESSKQGAPGWRALLDEVLASVKRTRSGIWAVATSLAVVVVGAGLYFQLSSQVDVPTYQTLSSDDPANGPPLRFRVRLAGQMSDADAQALFQNTGAKLNVVASDDGSYILEMTSGSEPGAAAALLRHLKSSASVTMAELILE